MFGLIIAVAMTTQDDARPSLVPVEGWTVGSVKKGDLLQAYSRGRDGKLRSVYGGETAQSLESVEIADPIGIKQLLANKMLKEVVSGRQIRVLDISGVLTPRVIVGGGQHVTVREFTPTMFRVRIEGGGPYENEEVYMRPSDVAKCTLIYPREKVKKKARR